jgi:hypothetical protein
MKKFILKKWYNILYQFDQHRNDIPNWWYENQPLDRKPDWMQRVIIACDVIEQIKLGRYYVQSGRYVSRDHIDAQLLRGSIKNNFDKINNCQVCAIGSCFLSIVKFKNNVNFEEIGGSWSDFVYTKKFRDLLLSFFSAEQLVLIEIAFEESVRFGAAMWDTTVRGNMDYYLRVKARKFGEKYPYPDDKLIAIMQNIIDNKGEFKP